MVWSTVHDEMLCREILVVDPFTGTKKGTVARGTKWEEVAENLNKIELCIPHRPSHPSRIFRSLHMEILDFSRSFLHTAK